MLQPYTWELHEQQNCTTSGSRRSFPTVRHAWPLAHPHAPCLSNRRRLDVGLSQAIRDRFDPKLVVTIEVEELNDRVVLALSGQRDHGVPYHECDGRAWIREGTQNRKLGLVEKQQLMKRGDRDSHSGPWRCDRCGAWVGVLHSFVVSNEAMRKTYRCRCGGEFWPAT